MLKKIFIAFISSLMAMATFSQADYFYPNTGAMNPAIPSPEKFLGYAIGTHHTRHDKLVEYFKELDRLSDRVTVQVRGESYEKQVSYFHYFNFVALNSCIPGSCPNE